MAGAEPYALPEGIFSILDTDLYKLTMHCAVLKHFPKVVVAYRFTNRTPHMRLSRAAFQWLQLQVTKLGNLYLTPRERKWLRKTCPYLGEEYLTYLESFRLKPSEQVELTFTPTSSSTADSTLGDLDISLHGLWLDTILYEIPLLALTSEAYFKFIDTDWSHEHQESLARDKGLQLLRAGCVFSEFGSRRRRDYKTHDLIIRGLISASEEATKHNLPGKLSGTSNVHLAMKRGLPPVGTVAHEWFMAIAAIKDDYARANELALQYWTGTFGRGVLAIALTDTFGTPAFLSAFAQPAPPSRSTDPSESEANAPTYAQIFTGVRQDSGDPEEYVKLMKEFYESQGIADKKVIVFSDSLNIEKCIHYKSVTEAAGLTPSFGIGTFFTNDFSRQSNPEEKSVPMNIVIKLSEADGRPAVKLSDNKGKNTGEGDLVRKVKDVVGYREKEWEEGDEGHRWDK